ncbi:hypothetical protein BCV70DRAFT_199865, partial [Testicularia cyperi]
MSDDACFSLPLRRPAALFDWLATRSVRSGPHPSVWDSSVRLVLPDQSRRRADGGAPFRAL